MLLDQLVVFDTIDHGIFIDCPSSWFGVSGVVLDWFKSYLSNCSCINIGCILTDSKKPCMGCPRTLSLVQYCFHYILLPSTKLFEIVLA